jgi:hypothetical protein
MNHMKMGLKEIRRSGMDSPAQRWISDENLPYGNEPQVLEDAGIVQIISFSGTSILYGILLLLLSSSSSSSSSSAAAVAAAAADPSDRAV